MKLKSKLIMSGVALAACAATLTSTTYAWYTSNTSVDVSNVSALTETAATGDQLYVAAAQTYSETGVATGFSTYSASATPKNIATTSTLKPVYFNTSDKTYKPLTGESGTGAEEDPYVATYGDESSANVLEYVLRFRTTTTHDEEMPIYVSGITVTNTETYANAAQTALAYGGNTGIDALGAYNIDLLKAMKMDVYSIAVTNENGATAAGGAVARSGYSSVATYGLESFATNDNTNCDTPNAVGYYNAVTGAHLVTPTSNYNAGTEVKTGTAGSTGAVSLFSIPGTSDYVEVRFVFYLDGWDSACYDVCRNQGFKVELSFSTASNENVLFNVSAS